MTILYENYFIQSLMRDTLSVKSQASTLVSLASFDLLKLS